MDFTSVIESLRKDKLRAKNEYLIQLDLLDRAIEALESLQKGGVVSQPEKPKPVPESRVIKVCSVPSDTIPGTMYDIKVSESTGEITCTCPGFTNHGHCKHIDRNRSAVSKWRTLAQSYSFF